jgi:arylsulfatase A-like enzyme
MARAAFLWVGSVAAFAAACAHQPSAAVPGAPYVVLVTIDTLRADATSPYGAPAGDTPHLAAFARESVQFEQASTVMPTTGPAHLSMLTGLYPQQHGALQNGAAVRTGTRSLAEIMRRSGRRTAAFVSVHHLSRETLKLDGFEEWNAPAQVRDGKDTVDAATRWIDAQGGAPFFLWVHLFDPHQPYKAHADTPADITARLAGLVAVEVPNHGGFAAGSVTPSQQEKLELLYRADVHHADRELGRFLDFLDRRGLAERAVVVVTADHGEVLGEALSEFHYGYDHGEFLLPMEVRVPLWVRMPDGRRGAREERSVETRALFGTLAVAAGAPQPGVPSLPGLESAQQPAAAADAFVVRRSFQAATLPAVLRGTRLGLVRDGRLLVRVGQDGGVRVETWQCGGQYPTRLVPVSSSEPEIASGLAAIEGWVASLGSAGAAAPQPVDDATRSRLRALGYLD